MLPQLPQYLCKTRHCGNITDFNRRIWDNNSDEFAVAIFGSDLFFWLSRL
jgi:hypothetical protein